MAELAKDVMIPIFLGQFMNVIKFVLLLALQKGFGFANREAQIFYHYNVFSLMCDVLYVSPLILTKKLSIKLLTSSSEPTIIF